MDSDRRQRPNDDLFADDLFRWTVAHIGYRWVRSRIHRDRNARWQLLTENTEWGNEIEEKRYSPLCVPELFERLARTEPTDEGILTFANQFGLLGVEQPIDLLDTEGDIRYGETFHDWESKIRAIRIAVSLWRVVQNDQAALRDHFTWRSDGKLHGWEFVWKEKDSYGKLRHFIPSGPRTRATDDITRAAKIVIGRMADEVLLDQCATRLLWSQAQNKLVVRIVPKSLLGAAWWQFSRAVVGEIKYKTCKACPKPMEISLDGISHYKNREFCSSACKQRFYREKVKKAKELHKQGVSVRKIADQLETERETVKGWLSNK